jgi:hypothetical protein
LGQTFGAPPDWLAIAPDDSLDAKLLQPTPAKPVYLRMRATDKLADGTMLWILDIVGDGRLARILD